MTAGRVSTMCESYLGLRHGPMSYVHQDTLVMCFLSSDPTLRAYETDLLRELDQKGLVLLKVVIGEDIPVELIRGHDAAIECQGLSRLGDEDSTVICVIAGQLSAFFRCLGEGLRPDSPFEDGLSVGWFRPSLCTLLKTEGVTSEPVYEAAPRVGVPVTPCFCFFIFLHFLFFVYF